LEFLDIFFGICVPYLIFIWHQRHEMGMCDEIIVWRCILGPIFF